MNDALRQRLGQSRDQNILTRPQGKGVEFALVVFGLFWCAFVGAFDYLILKSFIPQVGSIWFQPAPARIIKSERITSSDSDGTTHGVSFVYTYSVGGTNYTSDLYKFDKAKSSDSAWTRQAVSDFPAGSDRTCYYDPKNPARAVLAPGIHGSDIMQLMFMTPFNIVTGFFVAYPLAAWRNRRRPTLVPPRTVDRIRNREAYAMNQHNPLAAFVGVFLVTSFIGIFVVVFSGGFHPSLPKVVTVWGTAFLISVAVVINWRFKTKAGRYDLVIDLNSQTVTIPAMHKRATSETVPIAEIKNFNVLESRSGSGDDEKVTWQVRLRTKNDREFLLQDVYAQTDAERLATTLNARIRL